MLRFGMQAPPRLRTKELGLRTKDLGLRTKYHRLRTKDYGLTNFLNASRHSRRLRLGMNDPPKIRTKETKD